jgi:hypothetical protein
VSPVQQSLNLRVQHQPHQVHGCWMAGVNSLLTPGTSLLHLNVTLVGELLSVSHSCCHAGVAQGIAVQLDPPMASSHTTHITNKTALSFHFFLDPTRTGEGYWPAMVVDVLHVSDR